MLHFSKVIKKGGLIRKWKIIIPQAAICSSLHCEIRRPTMSSAYLRKADEADNRTYKKGDLSFREYIFQALSFQKDLEPLFHKE